MNSIKLLVLVAIACAGIAHAASFDCAKAHSKVEKMICVDAELSRLDDDLSGVSEFLCVRRECLPTVLGKRI